jgi:predicted phosphodiesterase
VQFGALGDIHGDFAAARRIMERHADVPFWVSVGDLANDQGQYEDVPRPLYWIKGNNENFDLIAAVFSPGHQAPAYENLHYVPNARLIEIPVGRGFTPRQNGGFTPRLTIAGLGGTLAPTWYETRAADLPHPKKGSAKATESADKRRHFVREEVEACAAMRGVDLLLTHEAPRPYRVGRLEAGKAPVNDVLASMRPRLHLFGHHHRLTEQDREGIRSVGLDLVSRSYLLVDADTMEYDIRLGT